MHSFGYGVSRRYTGGKVLHVGELKKKTICLKDGLGWLIKAS